jgi:hypothetical protein
MDEGLGPTAPEGPCVDQCRAALAVLESAVSQLGMLGAVQGLGLAFGESCGRERPVLTVRVGHRCALRRVLPPEIEGLPVCIDRAVDLALCAWWGQPRVAGGLTVRANSIRQGTLGCLVSRDRDIFALTCEHVLADHWLVVRPGVHAPWRDWRRRKIEWRHLGPVSETSKIDYNSGVADSDSALIRVECEYSERLPKIGRTHSVPMDEYAAWRQKARVCKVGAATGRTFGRVTAVVHGMSVKTPMHNGGHVFVKYPPLIEIAGETPRLCGPGDSGSVFYFHQAGYPRAPLGLLCSTSYGSKGYAIPMKIIFDFHGVRAIQPDFCLFFICFPCRPRTSAYDC